MTWQPIPEMVDVTQPPFDGVPVLLWADSACVNIVRLAWWRDYERDELEFCGDWSPEDTGWWSYQHSVTQEKLDYLTPTYWMPFEQPAPLMDERACERCGRFHMSQHACQCGGTKAACENRAPKSENHEGD